MPYLEITNDLTREGRKNLKKNQVLIFDFEGSPIYLKIMKKDGGRVWAKKLNPAKFLKPEEADEQVMVVPKIEK